MVETEVLILGAIATLFVIGWSILGIKDAFRSEAPQASATPEPSVERQTELTHQR